MFLKNFIKKGLIDAVGKMPDYQVILNAAGWHEKGVLTEEDLSEIDRCIEAKNAPPVEPDAALIGMIESTEEAT